MNNLIRRDFLKKLFFTSLATGSLASKSYALPIHAPHNSLSTSDLNVKMLEAYKNWTQKFKQTPEKFLITLNQNPTTNKSVSHLSKKEFETGNTINFDGMVLGKTEAALILHTHFN